MIRAIITDCDGVLTADKKWYTETGKLIKQFSTKDTTVIRMLEKHHRVPVFVLSGDDRVNYEYCKMHKIPFAKAVHHKGEAVLAIATRAGLRLEEILFIGDDLPDIVAGNSCGIFLCPSDAAPEVLANARTVPVKGGDGVLAWIYGHLKHLFPIVEVKPSEISRLKPAVGTPPANDPVGDGI